MKKGKLILTFTMISIVFFTSSYIFTLNKMRNLENDNYNKVSAKGTTANYDNVIRPDTMIVIRNNYTKGTGFAIENVEQPGQLLLGLDKTKAEEHFKKLGYNLIEFTQDKVIVVKDIISWCPDTYVLKGDETQHINIYKVNGSGELELYEETDVRVDMLPEGDKNNILKGKTCESLERAEEIIEEYES